MIETYKVMLKIVRNRMLVIKEVALEHDIYNDEWHELIIQENSLIKLIKIADKQKKIKE